jgi:hypothetical protein
MEEMPSLDMPVQRLKVAILPLDLPCSGPVTHSGEILTTGKSQGKKPDRFSLTRILESIYQSPSMQLFVVLSDESQGYMFRPLGGHLQATKIHTSKIRTATSQNTTESPRENFLFYIKRCKISRGARGFI